MNKLFLKESGVAKAIRKKVDLIRFELTGNTLINQLKLENEVRLHKPYLNRISKKRKPAVHFASDNMIIVTAGRFVE